jgi:mRNA-degrading endonuclease RelE of RelBE toxin-antitoxin system
MIGGIPWLKKQLLKQGEYVILYEIANEELEYLCSKNTRYIKVLSLGNDYDIQILAK